MPENAELAAILADYVPRGDYEEALGLITELEGDRDNHRKTGEESGKRLKELEAKYRRRSWRDAFEKVRKEAKVKDEYADDVYELLKLEPDADDADEGKIGKALETFLKEKKHYINSEETPRDQKRRERIEEGEGASRGGSTRPGDPEFRVNSRQMNDAAWMRDNQDAMLQAQRKGLLRIDD